MNRLMTTAFLACTMLCTPAFAQTPAEDHHESTRQLEEDHPAHSESGHHTGHHRHKGHHKGRHHHAKHAQEDHHE